MATVEEVFEQFKQLPDFDRYPMPEVFYQYFKVPKPKPTTSLMDSLCYSPPPHQSLNTNGKVELRQPAQGGVREIKEFQSLPVEVKKVNEETGELEEFPPPMTWEQRNEDYLKTMKRFVVTEKISSDTPQDSDQTTLNPPTEHNTKETQPE